jgi:geranylgeranyl transferase type-2 subunit alpha
MHSVKREDGVARRSHEELLREREKIEEYKALIKNISLVNDPNDILSISRSILLLNPESYQTWNLRRRALTTIGVKILGDELLFNIDTLKLNPKSYSSWHHRHWLLSELLNNEVVSFDWRHELRLCSKLLQLDSRNCTYINPLCYSSLLELQNVCSWSF